MERLKDVYARLVAGSNPRLVHVALGGLGALVLATLAFLFSGIAALLLVAGAGAVTAIGALVMLEDEKRRREEAAEARRRRAMTPPDAHEPVFPARAAAAQPAPASSTEPAALPTNRTYPESLRALLGADATTLPEGHVWPDAGRVRGSLGVRAQMAAQLSARVPVPATGPDAPLYVTYAATTDVATGLHVAALGFRATIVVALLDTSVHPGLSPAERQAVDDAVARHWMGSFAGLLTPPPVLELLTQLGADAAGPGGAYVLEVLEQVRVALRGGRGLPAAYQQWAQARAVIADEAARQRWSADQRAIAEVLCDWMLIQRAAAEDVAAAERDRGPGETRGDALQRVDAQASFLLERAVAEVLDPRAVARHAPAAARAVGEALGLTRLAAA